MTQDELLERLRGHEWTDFECKRARQDVPDGAYETVSAFANTEGGWLVFGISESQGQFEATGVAPDAVQRVQDAFLTTLRGGQKLNQTIAAEPHAYTLDGRRILAFRIPECGRLRKPVYLHGDPRCGYIRRGARDERMTDWELHRFLRDATEQSWDSAGMPDFPIEESLNAETLNWYQAMLHHRNKERQQIDDPLEFLRKWNFLVHESGRPVPTRATILLFGQDHCVRAILSRPVLDYQRIDARHRTFTPEHRWDDRVVFENNLLETWRGLVAKYMRMADRPFRLDPATMRRDDDPPEFISFREAAINLLMHQDYGDYRRMPSLKWYTDRMEFWNPGDARATAAQLLEPRGLEIRNPLIVDAFRRIGLSDQAGTGIHSILRNWNGLGWQPPEIVNDRAGKSFLISLIKEHLVTDAVQRFEKTLDPKLAPAQTAVLAFAAVKETITAVDAAMATDGKIAAARETLATLCERELLVRKGGGFTLTESVRERLAPSPEPSAQRAAPAQVEQWMIDILAACIEPRKVGEIQERSGIQVRRTLQRSYIVPLLRDGLLARTIPDKPRSRLQRYRTTGKGKMLLENTDE